MAYIKPKLTKDEAEAVAGLLRRWSGSEPARDRALRKLETALLETRSTSGKAVTRMGGK